MKKLLCLILFLPLLAYGQKMPDYGFDKIRVTDQDKVIQAEVLPVDSKPSPKPNLFYYWYSTDLIHATQGGYSGRLLNGDFNEYYTNKSLKEQGQFVDGLKNGTWRDWNEKGFLISVYSWKKGLRSGDFKLFDDQGKIKQEGKYKNDMPMVRDSSSFWKKLNIFRK